MLLNRELKDEGVNLDFEFAIYDDDLATKVQTENFEKENASEKKRKKIYMTESEINKLIENRKSEKGDGEDIEDEYDDVDDIEEKIDPNPEEDTKK